MQGHELEIYWEVDGKPQLATYDKFKQCYSYGVQLNLAGKGLKLS